MRKKGLDKRSRRGYIEIDYSRRVGGLRIRYRMPIIEMSDEWQRRLSTEAVSVFREEGYTVFGSIRSATRGRKGFTLIELLVVIAIIAILAAILFPVFTKARDNAKLARCMVHLGQIGKAVQSYCDDNDGRYPIGPEYVYDSAGRPTGFRYSWWTGQMIGGLSPGYPTKPDNWGNPTTWTHTGPKERPLYKYTAKNLDIWKCPSERKQHYTAGVTDFPSVTWGNSYTMNAVYAWNGANSNDAGSAFYTLMGPKRYIGDVAYPAPKKTSEVRRPTKIWMVGERTLHHYWNLKFQGGNGAPPPLGHQDDKPFSPVVFCDGHTGTIMMTSDVLADPNNRWGFIERGWHPDPKWKNMGVY